MRPKLFYVLLCFLFLLSACVEENLIDRPGNLLGIGIVNSTNGTNGVDGLNGTNGINGINGTNGIDGMNGTNGESGGWLNTSTTVYLANNESNVTVNNGVFLIDNTNHWIGMNTNDTRSLLTLSDGIVTLFDTVNPSFRATFGLDTDINFAYKRYQNDGLADGFITLYGNNSPAMFFLAAGDNGNPAGTLRWVNGQDIGSADSYADIFAGKTNSTHARMIFTTLVNGAYDARMTISEDGYVGVNETAPSQVLSVMGNTNLSGSVYVPLTVGKVVCIKADSSLGVCSGVVSILGACTCV